MNHLFSVLFRAIVFSSCLLSFAACTSSDEKVEGDRDDTDIFAIPLDSSGPADERILDRLEETEKD